MLGITRRVLILLKLLCIYGNKGVFNGHMGRNFGIFKKTYIFHFKCNLGVNDRLINFHCFLIYKYYYWNKIFSNLGF